MVALDGRAVVPGLRPVVRVAYDAPSSRGLVQVVVADQALGGYMKGP